MPLSYVIPVSVAMLLLVVIPFVRGEASGMALRLILILCLVGLPPAIAALEARNVFDFFAIWILVLLAPLVWLMNGGGAGGGGREGAGEGLLLQILPWLPLLALGLVVVTVLALKFLHIRAKRRQG
ncbi:hypothetical protein [Rhodobacter sp. 24-YEA-8]|uniref:hypothetical protein n=1 Tax=Rhodobacter sp. 24-YEA-8 TaxID=1884310 RepID=UPI00089698ED|nr:hypothetical protein [Rhodobacter sp. 24-YEA-8]SEC07555.1 hypothetical protein SAMN05519105_1900 [Rhodobacter sp. 24-YEA-8]